MWPKNGKGEKGGSKPNQGGKESAKKARATRTKLKALSAEAAAKALQESGELDSEPQITSEEQLEAEIFKAAQQSSLDQQAREEAARSTSTEFLKIPDKSVSLDEQLSDVWKAKLAGTSKPALPSSGNMNVPGAANRVAMEAAEKARMNAQHEAMIGVVDRMFDHFQNLAYEFNQVAAASDLELTWIRPSIARENVGSWHQGAQYISVFSGRISTRYWTLVVRGSFEGITAHIIPADKLLTFNSNPSSFMAILDMAPYFDGSMMYWTVAEQILNSSDMDVAFRACLDSLVQVAQDDVPPAQPIDLFAAPVEEQVSGRPQTTEFMAPGPSMMGGDINYSERYKQHFSSDSTNLSTGPANHGQSDQRSAPPNPYQSTNTSVNQNAVNFQGMGTSVNQNAVNQADDSDDWKPIVRQVRQSSGNQANPLNQSPQSALSGAPSQPVQPQQQSYQTPPTSTPQFSKPPVGPGNDGWRSVPASNSSPNLGVDPPTPANAFGQPFRPSAPQVPAPLPLQYQQPQQPQQQPPQPTAQASPQPQQPPQFQAPPAPRAKASSDDWNFVPIEKNPEGQAPKDPNQLPPVSFPSGLFADMPANLGFSAEASAKLSQMPGTQIPPMPQIIPLAKMQNAQPQPAAPASQSWGPVQITGHNQRQSAHAPSSAPGPSQPSVTPPAAPSPPAPQAPPASSALPNRPQHLPPQRPQSFPALVRPEIPAEPPGQAGATQSVQAAPGAASESPWSVAPTDSRQIGNRGEVQGTAADNQNMISPPPAPLPPSLPASSSGSVSVDRIAFSIANQSVPPAPEYNKDDVPDFDVADVLSDALAEEIEDWEAGINVEPVVDLAVQLDEELAAEAEHQGDTVDEQAAPGEQDVQDSHEDLEESEASLDELDESRDVESDVESDDESNDQSTDSINEDSDDDEPMATERHDDLAQLAELQEETFESIQELQEEMAVNDVGQAPDGDDSQHWRGPEQAPSPSSPTMPDFEPISISLGGLAPDIVAANQHSIKSEIERVISAFEKELELISSKGSEAFARRDLKGAEHMIKLAETISEYKDALTKLKDDYDKDLS